MRKRLIAFFVWCAVSLACFAVPLATLIRHSLEEGYSSHIVLIPLLTTYLIWLHREEIFVSPRYSPLAAVWPCAIALATITARFVLSARIGEDFVALLTVISVLLLLIAGFVAIFGTIALRRAIFPLSLLGLVVPVPGAFVNKIIQFLQAGSTDLTAWIFSAIGVPVLRNGFVLTVPGVSIEVATECSGINSSIALLIIMLLVAYESLNSAWARALLILVVVPLSILKNAIRIVTLTLLATRVDPGFLTGRLHHEGGFVFFLIALAIFYPFWKVLQRTENHVRSLRSEKTAEIATVS